MVGVVNADTKLDGRAERRMALKGIWSVLYYGIFASLTGGWLPVRAKNMWLVIFHLYLFLTFIALPLTVYLVSC